MTPTRKRFGKALARGCRKAIAEECIKDTVTHRFLKEQLARVIRRDLRAISSTKANSLLSQKTAESLTTFSWDMLLDEFHSKAPFLMFILNVCMETKGQRKNTKGVVGMCMALIIKHRFGTMSLVQRIVSMVLYSGHAGKQVRSL